MRHTLFENPMLLYVLLSLVWMVTLAWFWSRRTRRARMALLLLPVLAGVIYLASAIVETRREKVLRSIAILQTAVERADADGVIERISPLYDNKGAKRDDLVRVVRWAMPRFRFERILFSGGQLRFEGDVAIADRWATVTPSPDSPLAFGPQQTHWELKLCADADGEWRLREILCLSPVRGTPETLRHRFR